MIVRNLVQTIQHPLAHAGRVLHEAALYQPDGLQGSRTADGISAKGIAVSAGRPGHQALASHHRPDGHARGDALGQGDDVGLYTPVLDGEHPAGAPETRLHLVNNVQDAVLLHQCFEPIVPLWGWHHVASLALDGLDEDGRHFFGRDNGLKHGVLDVIHTGDVAIGIFQIEGAAVAIAIGHVSHPWHQRREALALHALRCGQG